MTSHVVLLHNVIFLSILRIQESNPVSIFAKAHFYFATHQTSAYLPNIDNVENGA
jgi:hypothetical protein